MSAAPFHALNCASKLTVVSRFGRNGVIVLGRIVHPASFLVAPRPSECYWAVGWDASVDGQVPWVWLSQYTVPVMRCEHAILTQDGTRQAELDFLLLGSRAQGDFTRARCVLKLRFGPSCAGANLNPQGALASWKALARSGKGSAWRVGRGNVEEGKEALEGLRFASTRHGDRPGRDPQMTMSQMRQLGLPSEGGSAAIQTCKGCFLRCG